MSKVIDVDKKLLYKFLKKEESFFRIAEKQASKYKNYRDAIMYQAKAESYNELAFYMKDGQYDKAA